MEHRTNKSIREEFKVEDQWLKDLIKKQKAKLKYFGYLKRNKGSGKIIWEGKIGGKRGRGRPGRQWERDTQDVFNNSCP